MLLQSNWSVFQIKFLKSVKRHPTILPIWVVNSETFLFSLFLFVVFLLSLAQSKTKAKQHREAWKLKKLKKSKHTNNLQKNSEEKAPPQNWSQRLGESIYYFSNRKYCWEVGRSLIPPPLSVTLHPISTSLQSQFTLCPKLGEGVRDPPSISMHISLFDLKSRTRHRHIPLWNFHMSSLGLKDSVFHCPSMHGEEGRCCKDFELFLLIL